MAKKDSGPGCLMYFFFIALLAGLAAYILASNAFNFKTILTYGPSQYFANIVHFHKDCYCRAASPLKMYGDILPMDSLEGGKDKNVIATLREGSVFKLKGYRSKGYVTWIAVKVARGPEIVYGYFMAPEKIDIPTFWAAVNRLQEKFLDSPPEPFSNKYFSEIPGSATEQYRSGLYTALKTELTRTAKLRSASDPTEMQKIKESKEFKIIDTISSDSTVYYCPKSEFKKAKALYEAYLGNGFDTHYLQVLGGYSPGDNPGRQEGLILRIVDTWYFKLFVAVLILWLFKRLRKRSKPDAEMDANPTGNQNVEALNHEPQRQPDPVTLILSDDMSVGELKSAFQERFGASIRVYTTIHTKRLADDETRLIDLREVKASLSPVCIDSLCTVSEIEALFKELGIGIQVMDPDGGLAANDSTMITP
jgi:hypothetical protein